MSSAARWFFTLVVAAAVVFSIAVGVNLLPSRARAEQVGTIVPLFLTWGLIALTAVMGLAVAAFLVLSRDDIDSPA
jgi:hypothetical protein